MSNVSIEWLSSKFRGMVEDVPRTRIQHQGELAVGMEVLVGHRRCLHKARVVALKKPVIKSRTKVNAELRQKLLRRPSKIPRLCRTSKSTTTPVPAPAEDPPVPTPAEDPPTPAPAEDPPVPTPAEDPPAPAHAEDPSVPDPADAALPALDSLSDVSMDISSDSDSEAAAIVVHRPDVSTSQSSAFSPVVQPLPTWPQPQPVPYHTTSHGLEATVLRLTEVTTLLQQQNQALLYEVAELRKEVQHMTGQIEKTQPKFAVLADDQVLIGSAEASLAMGREEYLRCWEGAADAKDLVLRLMSTQFTREELAASNFNGGDVFNGKERVTKRGLREDIRFKAMIAQADVQFPGGLRTEQQRKQLRDSVNNKCRKSSRLLRV